MNAPLPAAAEMADFVTKAARAATLLTNVRDTDVDVAATPREEIARINGRTLWRLTPQGAPRVRTPILVLYAMVGRWTVLDLQDDRSFLRNLSAAGCDIYVLDWGHPTRADRYDDFGDLIDLYLDAFVERICDRHGIGSINLLGICQGGVLSLIYAALYPDRVRNLITCVTPVDFHADLCEERLNGGFMNVWTRGLSGEDLDLLVDTMGNIPGEVGGAMFSLMTPFRTLAKYNLTLLQVGQDPASLMNFLRMEKWLSDRPDHTGESARQWLKQLYQENRLVNGMLEVGGRAVDLKRVGMPVLNIYSETDTVIPPPASRAMAARVGTQDYKEAAIHGGHIGVFCSRNQQKLQSLVTGWLTERDR